MIVRRTVCNHRERCVNTANGVSFYGSTLWPGVPHQVIFAAETGVFGEDMGQPFV